MYTGISIAILCIEIILIIAIAYFIFKRNAIIDKKSLIYLLPVFLITYSLYLTAMIYAKQELNFQTLFLLIGKSIEIFKMDLNYSLVEALCKANAWYNAVIILTCILSFLTVIFSVLVLFGSTVLNEYKKRKIFSACGDIVVGVSDSSLEYLQKHKNALLWMEPGNKTLLRDLIKQGYVVHQAPLNEKSVSKRLTGKEYHLIVFRDALNSYVSLLSCFEALKASSRNYLFLHLEANLNEMSIIREEYLSDSPCTARSFIIPFCRYELMARQFITEHPITKYIPRTFFNDNLTLQNDKEINVVFLGLGKVNYEIFKLATTSFHFAKQVGNTLTTAPVHYYIFEKETDKLDNEYFIRLLDESPAIFNASDLPPADKICNLEPLPPMNAHSAQTRKKLCDLVNENTYTYFIISLTEDFEDATLAYNIQNSLNGQTNYKIFVRHKGEESGLFEKMKDNIIYFGKMSECISHEHIVNDDLMQLSKNVNDLYNTHTQSKFEALREWQNLPIIEQYSNIHSALHIYFKLHLLGCSLTKKQDTGLAKDTFENLYPTAFMREQGDRYEYFFRTDVANVLAFIEHSRWNAYYIMAGYKPLPFKDFSWVKNEKGFWNLSHKNIEKKRHACLTTYQGLDQLIRYKHETIKKRIESGNKDVSDADLKTLAALYRYDYMVIDGMYDALHQLGYSIVLCPQS